jgi:NAD(P)H-flavin reductase
MSHEELKASHQVLGRIVFLLFCLHTVFYLNFFILAGVFFKRVKNLDVICGIVSIILFSVISTTALARFRRWSYRVFYFWHVLLANLVILFLYTHVTHIRPYTNQVLGVIVFRSALRFLSTRKRSGTVKLVPGTDLVQVGIPLSEVDSALKWKPGQHVYLGLLSGKQHLWDMQTETNPFTVASIPGKDKELLLVARIMKGNTKLLAERARSHAATDSEGALQVSLLLEGPYGASVRLPDFSKFDRVLLVAGGVGATFTLPIYRSIVESTAFKESGTPKIRFVWALRKLAEIKWAFDEPETSETETASSLQNSLVEVFVTRRSGSDLQAGGSGEDIEMVENEQLLSTEEQMDKPPKGAVLQTGRPKLSAIVDQVFSQSSRVAVFTCGPKSMTEQLVHAVEHWVRKGHDVYWHEETFGW